MRLTDLQRDDEAVSPVIGVILMVAITVILAAVIGTFVLGLGSDLESTSPQASFTFDFDSSVSGTSNIECGDGTLASDEGKLTITHDGGDSIAASQLRLVGMSDGSQDFHCGGISQASDVTAGDSVSVEAATGDIVRVTWESSNGGDTATLGKWTGPDA